MLQDSEFPCDVTKRRQLSSLARLNARSYLRNEERYYSFLWRQADSSHSLWSPSLSRYMAFFLLVSSFVHHVLDRLNLLFWGIDVSQALIMTPVSFFAIVSTSLAETTSSPFSLYWEWSARLSANRSQSAQRVSKLLSPMRPSAAVIFGGLRQISTALWSLLVQSDRTLQLPMKRSISGDARVTSMNDYPLVVQ